MLDVDAARDRVHLRVIPPLGFVEAVSSREHDVASREQLLLERAQFRGRAGKRREFVHAVVHDALGVQVLVSGSAIGV